MKQPAQSLRLPHDRGHPPARWVTVSHAARPYNVVIIGAGFAGIGMAIRLKRAGEDDFLIIERADKVGGTWRDNTYPGCACDIPSHLYSFSFAPKADWSRRYPTQAEIEEYLEGCVEQFVLRPHLSLSVCLKTARFDETAKLWRLQTDAGVELAARIIVLAMGALHRPALPAIPGLEEFRGIAFHSARWNHAIDLQGREIAVVGTGASAIQFVPRIAERASRVRLFQRTPPWVLPKSQFLPMVSCRSGHCVMCHCSAGQYERGIICRTRCVRPPSYGSPLWRLARNDLLAVMPSVR